MPDLRRHNDDRSLKSAERLTRSGA